MIDKATRNRLAERKERVRRRINTKVDPENYEFIPAKKPIDYYDNDIPQRVAVFPRTMSSRHPPMSCRRNTMRISSCITPIGRWLKSMPMRALVGLPSSIGTSLMP